MNTVLGHKQEQVLLNVETFVHGIEALKYLIQGFIFPK